MERLIGEQQHGTIVFAEMDGNKIKSLYSKNIEHADRTYDGNTYLTDSCWGGEYEVGGKIYQKGMELAEDFVPHFETESTREIIENNDYYEANGSWCDVCGTFHDTDQYYDLSFIVNEYGLVCKSCATVEDLLVELDDVQDFFSAKDVTGMDFASDDFVEVETLFCDSSGFGSEREPALTERQARQRVQEILDANAKNKLYVGLTGIGQFQVYVTIWKEKKQKRKTA